MKEYLLMNKDREILHFSAGYSEVKKTEIFEELEVLNQDMLPFGFTSINLWLFYRKAFNHNQSLKRIMQELNCVSSSGFIKFTHASSIKDTYWIKEIDENVKWSDVSLFDNDFNETISKIAISGGLLGFDGLHSTSPELSVGGSFKKCFKRENDSIYLFKIGNNGFYECCDEPYSEVISSEVAALLCKNAVKYELCEIHGKVASKCKIFTNEKYGLVTASELFGKMLDYQTLIDGIESLGNEEIMNDFHNMLLTDAVTFNQDRHADNFGFLYENDSKKIISLCPVFDFNLALFGNKSLKELTEVGNCIKNCSPNEIFGYDFLLLGKNHCTSANHSNLKKLVNFTSNIKCSNSFTVDKKKILENIICRQAEGILDVNKRVQSDVFSDSLMSSELLSKFKHGIVK